jgi:RNase P subunit RPR2
MLCAKCGTQNAETDRFCAKCGTPLSITPRAATPIAPKIDAVVMCAKCGTKNADTDKFCAKCGTPLNPPARPVVPVTPKADVIGINSRQVSCAKCGTQNADTDKFCAKCGSPLNPPAHPVVTVAPKGEASVENAHQLFCAICGTQNPDSYKFCAKCGSPLVAPAPQAVQAAPKLDTAIMDASGVNAHLDLFQEKITIKRQDQDISLLQISSVQLKEAGDSTNGFLKFELSNMTETGQTESIILFNKQQQKTFEAIKQVIDGMMLKNGVTKANSIQDLEKLADLKTKGIITEEEFKAKKKQILGL